MLVNLRDAGDKGSNGKRTRTMACCLTVHGDYAAGLATMLFHWPASRLADLLEQQLVTWIFASVCDFLASRSDLIAVRVPDAP